MYLLDKNSDHTELCLGIARDGAIARGINDIIVASTTGKTGIIAARMLQGMGMNLIIVTHNVGFKEEGAYELSNEKRLEITGFGARILTGTMVLRGIGAAIRDKGGYSHEQVVADTLRIFGQGAKVCCEITAMASDAGLIGTKEVIAVAGTGHGADCVCVIKPASSNKFFEMRVIEILAKPR
ncbi:MAG: hypothetical protein AB1397_07585 [bacterium]